MSTCKKIRIGNDFGVRWTLVRCGRPEPLTGRSLTLLMTNEYRTMAVKEFTVEDNAVTFLFVGKDQRETGTYTLTLVENEGAEGMFTVDACRAFRLVPVLCEADVYTPGTTLYMESDITVPMNGLSAYELAVKNGFAGTEPEWLASLIGPQGKPFTYDDFTPEQIAELQKPATDAAKEANEAADKANEAAEGIDERLATKQDTLVSGENIHTINGQSIVGTGNIILVPYIMHLPWKTNAATTRKQVSVGMRARGVKISYNDNKSVYNVGQYQSDDISDEAWGNDANWKGCRTPMTPMFEAAGAKFDDETGYYELNGLIDLTEDEMITMYRYFANSYDGVRFNTTPINGTTIRTNFPLLNMSNRGTIDIYGQSLLKVLCLQSISDFNRQPFKCSGFSFYADNSLETVIGDIYVGEIKSMIVYNHQSVTKLKDMNIRSLKLDMNIFQYTPVISIESLSFLVKNTANQTNITVTVHPDVYSKLTDPTNTEWYAVNEAAIAKNISFATTETQQAMVLSEAPTIQTAEGEMLAPAGYYLTQAKETPIEERMFLTRKVLLPNEDTTKWRIATEQEREEQERHFEERLTG